MKNKFVKLIKDKINDLENKIESMNLSEVSHFDRYKLIEPRRKLSNDPEFSIGHSRN